MADQNVPVVRTTFSLTDYCKAVLRAWKPICGSWPSKASVGCIWAQYALETGRGAFCWNANIGNVKYSPGHNYMMLSGTWEIIGGKRVVLAPPDRGTWFNAYDSLDDAMMEHLRLLKQQRYATCWPAIEAGDAGQFAVLLKQKGYYTAPVEDYARGLRAFLNEFMASPAFENACHDLAAVMEADTVPEMPAVPPDNAASSPTIHPFLAGLDPDDPPEAA